MVRSSRIRSTSESRSSSAVRSSNDPASLIFADATTLATACRNASRNSGWSSAMTRWVLAAVVIQLSCKGLRQLAALSSALSPVGRLACKRTILSCLKAVNPRACAPQYAQPGGRDADPVRRSAAASNARNAGAKGRKSYWGWFHGDVTLSAKPTAQSGQVRRWADFASTILGSDRNVHYDCNIRQGRRNDEGRTFRHSRFLARHRFRMV